MKKHIIISFLLVFALTITVIQNISLLAQETETPAAPAITSEESSAAESAQDAVPTKKARKEPRGILPPFYKDVVTEEQRTKIYGIQAQYNEKIRELEKQVAELRAERDAKVLDVLSSQQREIVLEKQQEALLKRAAKAEQRKLEKAKKAKDAEKNDDIYVLEPKENDKK
ncbi:MAG: hypothetical protein Q4C96_07915 [Planctomycetia bacterium]|nr:hypothetical protein [Planctomycetia bacterium]